MKEESPGLGQLVAQLCQANTALWQEEDKARVENDHHVAQAKRNIDKLNQRRNDLIEKIDDLFVQSLKGKGT